eukprot:TRINITY_DN5474_c0_g1_i1.p1 TRINITY_DN5474_c0_g1~~TRINITY_DN5474_c0_g1_i1.p1  ORF type:complete len:774 (-),score=227.45 TRINITY_DN5474_c0_g1_i1:37-2358(-)
MASDSSSNSRPKEEFRDRRHVRVPPAGAAHAAPEPPALCSPMLVLIGDKDKCQADGAKLEELVASLQGELANNKEADTIALLFQCVTSLPSKTPIYGTVVGLLNAINHDFGEKVAGELQNQLQQGFKQLEFNKLKLLLRFFAELVNANVILGSSLLQVLENILGAAQAPGNPLGRTDALVYLVIITLPWVARFLQQHEEAGLSHLISRIESHMTKRTPPPLAVYSVWEQDSNDFLAGLWRCLLQASNDKWTVDAIKRPYLEFETKLNASYSHALTAVDVPPHVPENEYPRPRTTFTLFPADTTKDIRPLDKLLLADYVVDLLYHFNGNHKEGIRQMMQLPLTVPYHAVVVEAVFGQMFLLPTPPFRLLYYGTVLTDLCKMEKSCIPLLVHAVDILFDRLDSMDVECADRLSDWFAWHLSNFDFLWNWGNWNYVLKLGDNTAKVEFVRDTLEHCTRLSYLERVLKAVPPDFQRLAPQNVTPQFPYAAGTPAGDATAAGAAAPPAFRAVAAQFIERLRGRTAPEQVVSWLDGLVAGGQLTEETRLQMVAYCLLHFGCKSLSHITTAIERYLPLLQAYVRTAADRQALLDCVCHFWATSPLHRHTVIDRLLIFRVVDSAAVVNWVFAPQQTQTFARFHAWEVLRNVVGKTVARTEAFRAELKAASERAGADADTLRKLRGAMETSAKEQRELLLLAFQRFGVTLTEHLGSGAADDAAATFWYHKTSGHLKEFLRKYWPEVSSFQSALQVLFTGVDPRISTIFAQMQEPAAVRALCE